MARDISELGADVYDDTPKEPHKISPKKRNYIIGLSISAVLLAGTVTATVILCNTALTDYSNVQNVTYYFTPDTMNEGGEKTCVLYKLQSDVKYPSTFRVPSQVKGYKVVGIADTAFAGHKEIKHVVLANTVKFVGQKTFYNCTNLSKFTWSKNLTDVGVDAFLNTAFYNNLLKDTKTLYYLPSGLLIYVGKDRFPTNTALISDALNPSEIEAIKTTYGAKNVQSFSEIGINNIASGAFKNNDKVCYIDLPSHLTEVSNATFEGCQNLKGLDATHSELTAIKERSFANCYSLRDIKLPKKLTSIGNEAFKSTGVVDNIPDLSEVEELGESIFANCTDLESVDYKGTYLPEYIFAGCTKLDEIIWDEDTVNFIGIGAFEETGFESIRIPKNVDVIYDEAFKNCENLETVYLYGNPEYVTREVGEEEEEDESTFIDDDGNERDGLLVGVEAIRSSAFEDCTSLATISLYNDEGTAYKYEEGTFFFPNSLKRLDVSSTILGNDNKTFTGTKVEKIVMTPNLLNVGSFSFENATSLEEVTITNSEHSRLTAILDSGFKGCTSLRTFDLPASIATLSASAFAECESLTDIGLGDTKIVSLNAKLFSGCHDLATVDIPESVTIIKTEAFYQNYVLGYVVIPKKVNEINERAFSEMRTDESKMPIYFSCTVEEAKSINRKDGWRDDTCEEFYLLGDGEERLPGYNYWKMGSDNKPEQI